MPANRSGDADGAERAAEAQGRDPEVSRVVNLALQGGGAHGAFTWGVLDRLLEEPTLAVEGVTGTSAGAMNGALVVCGLLEGGPETARAMLEDFWQRVSRAGMFSPLQPTPFDKAFGNWNMDTSPTYLGLDFFTRMFSPYEVNPLNLHPLRDILEQVVDLGCLRRRDGRIKFFVSATNVRTGRVRVFRDDEVTIEVLLASACMPTLFQAIEIDGDPYWDGGFTGNPALHPLYYACAAADIVIVQVNPINQQQTPTTAREILDRMNEISFNASLMRDMRAIEFVSRLIDEGRLDQDRYKKVYIHMIGAEAEMNEFDFSTKLITDWDFLIHLRDLGRETADAWLAAHLAQVGRESSIDIRGTFL